MPLEKVKQHAGKTRLSRLRKTKTLCSVSPSNRRLDHLGVERAAQSGYPDGLDPCGSVASDVGTGRSPALRAILAETRHGCALSPAPDGVGRNCIPPVPNRLNRISGELRRLVPQGFFVSALPTFQGEKDEQANWGADGQVRGNCLDAGEANEVRRPDCDGNNDGISELTVLSIWQASERGYE